MKKKENKKFYAFLTTFFSILGFIIAMLVWRKDKYIMHYAAQSLIVFILIIIGSAVQGIFLFLPIIGDAINLLIDVAILLAWLFSWVYALSGEKREVPFIGHWEKKLKL